MIQAFVFDGRQRSTDAFGHANGSLTYLCVYHQRVMLDEEGMPVEAPLIEQGCSDDPQLTLVDTLESLSASVPALVLTEELCIFDPETGEVTCEPGSTRTVPVEAAFTASAASRQIDGAARAGRSSTACAARSPRRGAAFAARRPPRS